MYDAGKIVGGLVVFLVLVTAPLWLNAVSGAAVAPPQLKMPTDSTQCVEAREYMRASHMDLLNQWRDQVVRQGAREYRSTLNGKSYEMSLSKTCLSCHADKAGFCDACHTYMAVSPYCWSCHVEPKGGR
jgi:hypothetical protein